jgi:drug/metabolite transporter (DMT)-like permease
MTTRTEPGGRRQFAIPLSVGWGILLAVGAALISGLAIYLNGFAVKQLPDAALYTTLKNAVAAWLLIAATVGLRTGREVRSLDRRSWVGVVLVGVVGGSIPFILFFSGLAQASAPSAAFIQKTLFVWVALAAVPFLGERLGFAPLIALVVLLIGQAVVLPPEGITWGSGETMILLATLLWAVETIVVKRLLTSIPTSVMTSARMGIGLVVLVGYLAISGRLPLVGGLSQVQWGWILLTGLILAGYVATWFSALRRAPASVVTSVLVVGAVITGVLTSVAKGIYPNPTVVGGYVLIVAAAAALGWWSIRTARRSAVVAAAPAG